MSLTTDKTTVCLGVRGHRGSEVGKISPEGHDVMPKMGTRIIGYIEVRGHLREHSDVKRLHSPLCEPCARVCVYVLLRLMQLACLVLLLCLVHTQKQIRFQQLSSLKMVRSTNMHDYV